MMHGLVELLNYVDAHAHFVLSCLRALPTWGFCMCFVPCFAYPMLGKDISTLLSL